ncbi:MAG: acetyl/propionyl/methylcrotonyl-CoA carboxylase subunit alpha [Paludibacterium sp.]|uniref:acetyl/propionyl/methylcrotonyl-CoA carboxylase subunit alpha n=1 Tax=Paludibacterium sp. TaxID=1917523 RepID=UPI0025CBED10|nr:acetyl/propionyl/methylcrotonyl-CoA carboxylase subunit alpha [Paludibacterium sp.]MBV8047276.1 acetyl/propionyl/methylcrotonyl-CoA carboxylase subunit alpha [Paludibacterium sp.]
MLRKILIANRGEIACRVIKSARAMGIATVAVHVAADAGALFVRQADEAWHLAGESYLDIDGILAVARASGADAIHPGYGFLSENPAFARACDAAGIVFIGPREAALATMGSKSAAKTLLEQSAIPLVPGYHGDEQIPPRLAAEADRIGYPVLIKACSGGGGKGMRIVARREDFAAELAACQREAAASFGDERVLIEKYLQAPRHIEIQVFADSHGQCVYLFERDCSVQRRHQKVVEEAPAPGLSAEMRRAMGETACAVARAVDYLGAGTVEFIVDGDSGDYFFMEMNTRLQVEHPVTEMVTGLDLVAWQIRVAQGEPLPLTQAQLTLQGHAIEARLYAEDPQAGFLPSCGTLTHWQPPALTEGVRIDTGVSGGDTITPLFDPMLAKLIVWGPTRDEALARMAQALAAFQVDGVMTNFGFLHKLITHPAFCNGIVDTGFIERHQAALLPPRLPPAPTALALLALADTLAAQPAGTGAWDGALPGWRLGGAAATRHWTYRWRDETHAVTVSRQNGACRIEAGGETFVVADAQWQAPRLTARLNSQRLAATVLARGAARTLFWQGERWTLTWDDPLVADAAHAQDSGHLRAPMPGRVVALCAEAGVRVKKGTALLIMEAMKMEHTLFAPADGQVGAYHFAPGAQVAEGMDLLDFEAQDDTP